MAEMEKRPSAAPIHLVEIKQKVSVANDSTVAVTWTRPTTTLLPVTRGVGDDDRIGDEIKMHSISSSFAVGVFPLQNQTVAPDGDIVRILMIRDRQTKGANFDITDVLTSDDWDAPRNMVGMQRFDLLMDRMWSVNYHGASDGTADYAGMWKVDRWYKKLSHKVHFLSTAGNVTSIGDNNLILWVCSKNGVARMESRHAVRWSDEQ